MKTAHRVPVAREELAEAARLLLPHLAAALHRCLKRGDRGERIVRELARCGEALEAAGGR